MVSYSSHRLSSFFFLYSFLTEKFQMTVFDFTDSFFCLIVCYWCSMLHFLFHSYSLPHDFCLVLFYDFCLSVKLVILFMYCFANFIELFLFSCGSLSSLKTTILNLYWANFYFLGVLLLQNYYAPLVLSCFLDFPLPGSFTWLWFHLKKQSTPIVFFDWFLERNTFCYLS